MKTACGPTKAFRLTASATDCGVMSEANKTKLGGLGAAVILLLIARFGIPAVYDEYHKRRTVTVQEVHDGPNENQTPAPSPQSVGPSAIWLPGSDFVSKADMLCTDPRQYSDCRIDQMRAYGAPVDAVNFAREFARQYFNEVGVVRDFRNIGSADLITVVNPFRPIRSPSGEIGAVTYLLLIRQDPNAPSFDDPKNIDKDAIEDFKRQVPAVQLREKRRQSWLMVERQADGTLRYTAQYFTSEHFRVALFDFNFDAHGRFVKAHFSGAPLLPK